MLGACGDPALLARLGGPLGLAARSAAASLAALPEVARRSARASWRTAVRIPVPPGLRSVDASWIEAGLAPLPARARFAVARGGASSPVDVWLARFACADLPPLARPALSRAALSQIGLDQLALALAAAGGSALARAARIVGDDLREAAARISAGPRAGALGPARAAIERSRVSLSDPHALVLIGARTVAPHLDALARHQLATRFPRSLDLRAEMRAFEHLPGPSWSALFP